jgi:regulator of protease activity HflC (stomatin/prohibitin superfamily)
MNRELIREKKPSAAPGGLMLVVLLAALIGTVVWLIQSAKTGSGEGVLVSLVLLGITIVALPGLTVVNPNQGRVLVLFGTYVGTLKEQGFWYVNPFCQKRSISLKVRNFESSKLKVNDHDGNPIEIAAVVVWRVVETAEAIFQVDDYENFVHVQSEAALRNLATSYPYDQHVEGQKALRSHTSDVAEDLKKEIQDRLTKAGVNVIEARISHLAYAPEIAGAMLRRQQANAIVAARQRIVEGAVGMVEMALEMLSQKHVVQLDEERKAAMVSNLLVVLCSDQHTQPVVNTGSLYT